MKKKLTEDQKITLLSDLRKINAGPQSWTGVEWFPWSKLKAVLETKAVKTVSIWLVVIPVLVSFSSEFPDRYHAAPFSGKEEVSFVLQIPFNWYLLYFSAACFGIGRLVYVTNCPDFLRSYTSSAAAISDGVTASIAKGYASDFLAGVRVKNPLSPEGKRLDKFLFEITGKNNLLGQAWEARKNKNHLQSIVAQVGIKDLPDTGSYLASGKSIQNSEESKLTNIFLWKFIDWLDHSQPMARAICSVFVSLGFTFLAIPLLQGFSTVLTAFFYHE